MDREKRWHIDVFLDEHENRTRAEARLDTGATRLTGVGLARLSPDDTNVPEIGDELATSRALSALAHELLDTAASDIEDITHRPVHLTR